MGPDSGVKSGDLPAFRLVKYEIMKVYRGRYSRHLMVVDHPILTGHELRGVKVGSIMKLVVREQKLPSGPAELTTVSFPSKVKLDEIDDGPVAAALGPPDIATETFLPRKDSWIFEV
jgi:hypothetical protein